jgi:phytoene desaturase (3,4-didehydrolycopene-forming)
MQETRRSEQELIYQGPSLFLLPPLFHQLYTDLGTTLAEHIDLLQCHPNYVIHYHDGEKVTLSSDRAQLRQEVEKWEGPGGGEKLDAFLAYVSLGKRADGNREGALHASLSYSLVLSKAFPSFFSLLQPAFLKNFFNLHVLDSLYGRCSKYFMTERMRRAFSFGSM